MARRVKLGRDARGRFVKTQRIRRRKPIARNARSKGRRLVKWTDAQLARLLPMSKTELKAQRKRLAAMPSSERRRLSADVERARELAQQRVVRLAADVRKLRKEVAQRKAERNPRASQAGAEAQAADLYRRFHDADPRKAVRVTIRHPKALASVGRVLAIEYAADHGKNYRHDFARTARPVLAASPDGRHLYVIGTRFRFTERGIVDR